MFRRFRKFRLIKSLPLIPTAIALLMVILGGGYLYTRLHHSSSPNQTVTVGTPISAPQQKTSTPAPKAPTSNTNSRNAGGATDTHGTATTPTTSSQWVTSASGDITVKQPIANAKIQDGSILSGSAKVSEIHYRLNDNKVGVIAQGILEVVNGNFSGTLHFQPQGTGGRLDVFSIDSQGVEYNEIQINVSF